MNPREPDNRTGPSDRFRQLLFVFTGRPKPWKSLRGVQAPSGMVWEARAYPSLEYAIGASWEDAKANLRDLLEAELERAPRADEWYGRKLAELSVRDRQALNAVAFQVFTSEEELAPITLGSHDTIVVDDVQRGADTPEEEACPGLA